MSSTIAEGLRRAMGSFATGISVVTARGEEGQPLATTVNSLTSVSLEPPLVLVCLRRDSDTLTAIRASGRFGVDILSEHQHELSSHFASKGAAAKFEEVEIEVGPGQDPFSLPETLAHIRCELHELLDGGDHEIVLGRVVALEVEGRDEARPLLFFRSRYSRLLDEPAREDGRPPLPATPIRRADFNSTVLVIGGGASGALAAAQLLRRGADGLRVVVVERRERIGPGVAYSTASEAHRLNVTASQMVAFPDRADDFLEWAGEHRLGTDGSEYLPRHLFGEYLEQALDRLEAENAGRVLLERHRDEAVGLRVDGDRAAGPVEVELASGRRLRGETAILAIGNSKPLPPPGHSPKLPDSERYLSDPWSPEAIERARMADSVLLLGTGLTMVDVALSLARTGGPVVHAVSRSGLMPRSHGPAPSLRGGPMAVPDERCSLTELTARILTEVAAASGRGEDWRCALDAIRPIANQLWRSLSQEDRRRFHADLGRIWAVHRHRMAPQVAHAAERLIAERRLRVMAASIERIWPSERSIQVELRRPGRERTEPMRVDLVINCMGPSYNPRRIDHPLVRGLLFDGLLRPDPLGIGFDVDEEGALKDLDGHPSEVLFAIGPLRNGSLLETTAVPEIGQQAERLAQRIVGGEASPGRGPVLRAAG